MSGTDRTEQGPVRKDRPSGGRCSSVFRIVKGPWRAVINERYGTLGIVGNDNRRVANHKRAKMEWLYKTDSRSFAEVHLIAAAPEMLETLKATRAYIEDPKMLGRIDRVIINAERQRPVDVAYIPDIIAREQAAADESLKQARKRGYLAMEVIEHLEGLQFERLEQDEAIGRTLHKAARTGRKELGFIQLR